MSEYTPTPQSLIEAHAQFDQILGAGTYTVVIRQNDWPGQFFYFALQGDTLHYISGGTVGTVHRSVWAA